MNTKKVNSGSLPMLSTALSLAFAVCLCHAVLCCAALCCVQYDFIASVLGLSQVGGSACHCLTLSTCACRAVPYAV
jgi:hypothetical protein